MKYPPGYKVETFRGGANGPGMQVSITPPTGPKLCFRVENYLAAPKAIEQAIKDMQADREGG